MINYKPHTCQLYSQEFKIADIDYWNSTNYNKYVDGSNDCLTIIVCSCWPNIKFKDAYPVHSTHHIVTFCWWFKIFIQ